MYEQEKMKNLWREMRVRNREYIIRNDFIPKDFSFEEDNNDDREDDNISKDGYTIVYNMLGYGCGCRAGCKGCCAGCCSTHACRHSR